MVGSGAVRGVDHLGPQLEGELEVALGGRWRSGRGGSLPGPDRRRKRAGDVVGREPVMGEHRAGIQIRPGQLGVVLEGLGIGLVKLRALAREQVIVDRRAGQGVAEAVPASRRIDDQQLLLDRLRRATCSSGVGQPSHERQQAVRRPAGGGRHDAEHMLGARREELRAGQHDVA